MHRVFTCLTATLLCSGTALATEYTVCVEYNVSLSDADTDVGDDFITDDSDHVTADGVRIKVIDDDSTLVQADDYTSTGIFPGCLDVDIKTPSNQHRVIVYSKAESAGGNIIRVWDDDSSNTLYTHVAYNWQPSTEGNLEVVTPVADQWNMMAMFTFAMKRDPAGVTGEYLTAYTQSCPTSYSNCIGLGGANGHAGRLYLSSSGASRKYTIVHEMGHWVAWRSNGDTFGVASSAYNDTGNQCAGGSGHYYNTEEYQGLAAAEGIANYYAAATFNLRSEDDCGYRSGSSIDWDYSTTADDDDWSCDEAPLSGLGLDDTDYHADQCSGGADRGVEYDWLRFWWNVGTDYDVGPSDIFPIWDEANPQNWENSIDTATEDTGTDVANALHYAATVLVGGDVGDGYDDLYVDHGLDR